jgi:hypothetical protein
MANIRCSLNIEEACFFVFTFLRRRLFIFNGGCLRILHVFFFVFPPTTIIHSCPVYCAQRLPCCEVDCVSQRDGGRFARHDTLDSNAGNFVTRLLYEVCITPTLMFFYAADLSFLFARSLVFGGAWNCADD